VPEKHGDEAFGRDGDDHAEDGAHHGDEQAFDRHRRQERAARDADEPQDGNRIAPLLGANDHQRQQEGGGADDGDGGDCHMKPIQHGKRIVVSSPARGPHDRARSPRRQLGRERSGVVRVDQLHVDRARQLARRRIR